MDNRDERNRDAADLADPAPEGKQTDLAEGELSTVEESIRSHEQKRDAQGQPAREQKKDAA